MFEQAFKNIDDELRKDAGCSSELDYIEQTSWILFLKYLSDLEKTKEDEASLQGNTEGEIDHQKNKNRRATNLFLKIKSKRFAC